MTTSDATKPPPPIKVPNPPEGEVDDARVPDEIPKVGSRDAPGG